MALEKIPSFQHVKDWVNENTATSVNGESGDVTVSSGTPSGTIVMWSGSVTNIPDGWTLCDGSDGAPDLQDRFIVGAGGQYSVGNTGGESEVTLTEDEMPSHNHSSGLSTMSSIDNSGLRTRMGMPAV